mgnify:CR=1 FL=1
MFLNGLLASDQSTGSTRHSRAAVEGCRPGLKFAQRSRAGANSTKLFFDLFPDGAVRHIVLTLPEVSERPRRWPEDAQRRTLLDDQRGGAEARRVRLKRALGGACHDRLSGRIHRGCHPWSAGSGTDSAVAIVERIMSCRPVEPLWRVTCSREAALSSLFGSGPLLW